MDGFLLTVNNSRLTWEGAYLKERCVQCGGSGMFIPDPGSWFLPIPDPGFKNSNKRGEKKFVLLFLKSQISQNWILCYLWNAKEKNLAQFSKNCLSFYPKNFQYGLKNMGLGSGIRDPGSEIRDPRSGIRDPGSEKKPIPDPGSRGQKGTGSRIRNRNTGCVRNAAITSGGINYYLYKFLAGCRSWLESRVRIRIRKLRIRICTAYITVYRY